MSKGKNGIHIAIKQGFLKNNKMFLFLILIMISNGFRYKRSPLGHVASLLTSRHADRSSMQIKMTSLCVFFLLKILNCFVDEKNHAIVNDVSCFVEQLKKFFYFTWGVPTLFLFVVFIIFQKTHRTTMTWKTFSTS